MKGRIGVLGLFALALSPAVLHAAPPEPVRIERINDVPTLMVDNKPFLIVGAQCDGRTIWKQDKTVLAFYDGYQKMNATAVGVNIMWSKCEPEKDHYDFSSIDWNIRQAEARGLKIVMQHFGSNVCGTIEVAGVIRWTPEYIIKDPKTYSRLNMGTQEKPNTQSGWAMSPNDPNTLERERLYLTKLAEHLRDHDRNHTVIMLQINNEVCAPPAGRDHTKWSDEKFAKGQYKDDFDFMCRSLAEYQETLAKAVAKVYDIPMYLNSPHAVTASIHIFLDNCPSIACIGADAMTSPAEPNYLSATSVGRNAPFMAENPTDVGAKGNLDILPWYGIIGRPCLGNLLWEASWNPVVGDADATAKYSRALYPIKNAMFPLAATRGSERLAGWYDLRNRFFVREGKKTREAKGRTFSLAVDADTRVDVSKSVAGAIIRMDGGKYALATSGGDFYIANAEVTKAETGVFVGNEWRRSGAAAVELTDDGSLIHAPQPVVIQFSCKPSRVWRNAGAAGVLSKDIAAVLRDPNRRVRLKQAGDKSFVLTESKEIAKTAAATASSEFNGSFSAAPFVAQTGGEWASKGEADPWIKLGWEGPQAISQVVLADRPNLGDHVPSGTLLFSDGSSIAVTNIANDGTSKIVNFPVKTVTWVKFQATNGKTGSNNGLSLFEVYCNESQTLKPAGSPHLEK